MRVSTTGLYVATRLTVRRSNWGGIRCPFAQTCLAYRQISQTTRRRVQPADEPGFVSIVDNPPKLVRTGRRHGAGLILLGMKPSTM